MAGLRQGLAPLHPQGRNVSGGRGRPGFLVPRGMGAVGVPIALAMGWQGQGKKLRASPLQQGARGAAGRCQPKPLTRPWVGAGSCHRPQGDLARIGWGARCRADAPAGGTDRWACRMKLRHPADRTGNENARRAGLPWLTMTGPLAQAAGRWQQAPSALHSAPPRSACQFTGGDCVRHHPVRSMPSSRANDPASKPRPALPDGAWWRSRCGQGRTAQCRPLLAHAARRCSSISSSASAGSVSSPSTSSATSAAAGSVSSGVSASASHAARLAAATVATPPRWV